MCPDENPMRAKECEGDRMNPKLINVSKKDRTIHACMSCLKTVAFHADRFVQNVAWLTIIKCYATKLSISVYKLYNYTPSGPKYKT